MSASEEKFVVRITSRDNETCQGDISFMQKNKKMDFQSTLELIKLIDSAKGPEDKE